MTRGGCIPGVGVLLFPPFRKRNRRVLKVKNQASYIMYYLHDGLGFLERNEPYLLSRKLLSSCTRKNIK